MIAPERLEPGLFVAWTPRPHMHIDGLPDGHPGVIQLPDWQDVGVKWSGLETADVTTHAVYDFNDLTEIDVEEFSRRTLAFLASRG